MEENQLRLIRKAFSDISRGYSQILYQNKRLFVKHLSHHDQVDLDVIYKQAYDEAVNKGAPTEKEALKALDDEGVWTKNEEIRFQNEKKYLESLIKDKQHIIKPSDLQKHEKNILKQENIFFELYKQKNDHLGLTAEKVAEKRLNEYYIVFSFYLDSNLENRYLTEEKYNNLSNEDLSSLVNLYNFEMSQTSDKEIKLLAIQDFFQNYWSMSDNNVSNFFGKPICDLTYFQMKLASYGSYFKYLLEKSEGIPESIKSDPDKLMDYINASEKGKEKMESGKIGERDNAAVSMVGAKKEDYEAFGYSDSEVVDLNKEVAKKGELDMHDFMRLMGQSS